jgi:hypothetical protein
VFRVGWRPGGIIRHVAHPDDDVRSTAAWALCPGGDIAAELLRDQVVPALATLMADPDSDVRDRATFALAHHAIDGIDIRDLLFIRVTDADEDVRGEAIRGLARRHDARVIPILQKLLDAAPTFADLAYRIPEAAELVASNALLPSLRALRDRSSPSEILDQAIANADPNEVQRRATTVGDLLEAFYEVGIDVAISQDRFDPAMADPITFTAGTATYDVGSLLRRAGGSTRVAARLVGDDLGWGSTGPDRPA